MQLYQEDQSGTSYLRIAGYINDTGEYICEADYQGLKVKSNPIKIDIHGKLNNVNLHLTPLSPSFNDLNARLNALLENLGVHSTSSKKN